MPRDKHRECKPRTSVSDPFLVCYGCNGQGTVNMGYHWKRCVSCAGSGRMHFSEDLRLHMRVSLFDRLGKSYDFCRSCDNGYIRDVQGDGGWTAEVWLPCEDCGGLCVFLTDEPDEVFEPFDPDGPRGFYRVRLPDGMETWGYPNQGVLHLTTPDGKYFTDTVLGPEDLFYVRYAHDEFCAMTLEWADEERDAQIQQGKALARQLRGAQDASVSRVMQVSNSHTSIPKPQPIRKPRKVGRNEPCPCGSGSKHKRCCGKTNRSHP